MSDKTLEVGDLVWAKMKTYPFWPSKIVNPPANIKTPSSKKAQHCVLFFGSENYAWISDDSIVPHSTDMILSSYKGSKKISSTLQSAIDEIVQLSKNKHQDNFMSINGEADENAKSIPPSTCPLISNCPRKKTLKKIVTRKGKITKARKVFPKEESSISESGDSELSQSSSDHTYVPDEESNDEGSDNNEENKDEGCNNDDESEDESSDKESKDEGSDNEESKDKGSDNEESKDEGSDNDEESKDEGSDNDEESKDEGSDNVFLEESQHSEKSAEKINSKIKKDFTNQIPLKRPKEYSANESTNKRKCSSPETRRSDDLSSLLADVSQDSEYSNTDAESVDDYFDQPLGNRHKFIERPISPVFDVMKASDFLKSKEIIPTTKKIGFLGLGMIGRGVVKNLLLSGHKVTVWNRNPTKCEPFVAVGACKAFTPADVIACCDITFCCVSDSMAVKHLVFENCGVLKGFEGCTVGTKGYVEMSSIDAATVLEVSKAITSFGGRYLEAPVIGSREIAENGSLLSLVAGDRSLFNDCYSCFFAFTSNVYYLSSDVGSGCKMNLIHSMLFGTTSAALAEAMALVMRCELSLDSFMDILELGPLNCPLVLGRANAMAEKNFTTNTALKHQQKDLNYVLKLGNSCLQSTLTTSAANQVFKRAKYLNYSDHDVSAVLMGAH